MTLQFIKRIFPAAAIVCAVWRTYLHMAYIDPDTGFYLASGPLVFGFNTVFLLCMVLLPFLAARANIPEDIGLPRNTGVKSTLLFCGVCAAMVSIPAFLEIAAFGLGGDGRSMIATIAQLLLFAIGPLVTAVLFLAAAARGGNEGRLGEPPLNAYLMLIPVIWQGAIMLQRFMRFTASRHVSDQMLAIVLLVFAVPFLLAFARVAAGIDKEKGTRQMVVFGLLYALAAFTFCPAMFTGLAAEGWPRFSLSLVETLFYLSLGVFAVAAIYSVRSMPEPEKEALPAQEAPISDTQARQEGGCA